MVLLLFFCSGATALVYEVLWSKYLSLMFGSTVQAQTIVLAVFMGGLALGNRIFGRRSDLLRRPLATYGILEVIIGLYAFFFPLLDRAADWAFIQIGTQLLGQTIALMLLKTFLSLLLLIGPTILMGGTLPLLAAWLQRNFPDAARWSARFYSTNSLGAVFGAWLAGFVLVPMLGLVATLQMTALVNVLIGFIAIGLARRVTSDGSDAPAPTRAAEAAVPGKTESARTGVSIRRGILLVALTGAVSMGLEVLASRSLSLLFGASLQAFAIVLMSFILGIGLGSAAIASPRLRNVNPEGIVPWALLLAAGVVGILVWKIESTVAIYWHVQTGLARSEMGFRFHQVATAMIALITLGIPAAASGAVLPLCIRSESAGGLALGDRVGRLLTSNTLGAVAGVLLTGFVLMPVFGLRIAFAILALLLSAGALLHAASLRRPIATGAAAVVTLLLLLSVFIGNETWRHVLSSGVFRARDTVVNSETLQRRKTEIQLVFYQDAPDATVTVERGNGVSVRDDLALRINGKPEASTGHDMSTQLLLAHLPMLSRPGSKDVFILGFGSGVTAGAITTHPIDRLVVAENCRPVLKAGVHFAPWNRGVLTNPVAKIWNEDARTVLKLSPQKYDIIISEPSNPWMAGVGSVFSREFYRLAASRLKPGGLMTQWFHIYEIDDRLVNMVLRTFSSVFPHMEIWDSSAGDIILLGSDRPWTATPDTFAAGFQLERVRHDLARIGFKSPEALWARQFASQRTAFAIGGYGQLQSDLFPVLEYEAPKAFYIGTTASQLARFDERTWQSDLAAENKRQAIAGLTEKSIAEIFTYATANDELDRYLFQRFRRAAGTPLAAPFPHLFPPTDPPTQTVAPEQASDELKQLIAADGILRSRSGARGEALNSIEAVLQGVRKQPKGAPLNWSPAYFSSGAARSSLAMNEFSRAADFIALGLDLEPGDHQLHYLKRVLERWSVREGNGKPN